MILCTSEWGDDDYTDTVYNLYKYYSGMVCGKLLYSLIKHKLVEFKCGQTAAALIQKALD